MSYQNNKKTRGHPAASAAHDRVPIGGKRQQNVNNMMNIEDNNQ